MKLYELTDQLRRLLDTDDDSPAIDSMLEELDGALETKIEGVAMAIRNLVASEGALRGESLRMKLRARAEANRIKALKTYLLLHMRDAGITEVRGRVLKVRIQQNNPACQVDEDAVPRQFVIVVPETTEVDKRAILAHFRATGEVPDGVEITRSESVRIR